jgi:hypothetical protein
MDSCRVLPEDPSAGAKLTRHVHCQFVGRSSLGSTDRDPGRPLTYVNQGLFEERLHSCSSVLSLVDEIGKDAERQCDGARLEIGTSGGVDGSNRFGELPLER